MIWKKYPIDFRKLIYGRSSLNIADSFFSVAIILAIVEVYQIDVEKVSYFSLSIMIPSIFCICLWEIY